MPLSKEAIEEFKKIYQEKFGDNLDNQEAIKKATSLLGLIKTISRPTKIQGGVKSESIQNSAQKSLDFK